MLKNSIQTANIPSNHLRQEKIYKYVCFSRHMSKVFLMYHGYQKRVNFPSSEVGVYFHMEKTWIVDLRRNGFNLSGFDR